MFSLICSLEEGKCITLCKKLLSVISKVLNRLPTLFPSASTSQWIVLKVFSWEGISAGCVTNFLPFS
jgi:hypothetical protein